MLYYDTKGAKMTKSLLSAVLAGLVLSVASAQIASGGAMSGGTMSGGAAPAGSFVESADGAHLYYEVHGEGEPMVLIHGYPLNSGLFRDNVEVLSAEFQVITVDLRGFGNSETPNAEGSIATYATDTLAVMDELGIDQAIVAGMSMGGMTAFEMYRQAPERFAGLVLIDTTARPAGTAEAGLWNGSAAQAQEPDGLTSLGAYFTPDMLSGPTRAERPELVAYLGTLVGEASVDGAVGGGVALAERPDSIGTMANITVPTLILVGENDSLTPVEVHQEMQAGILNSELVILPGAAHGAIIEAADAANAAILEWAAGLPQ